MELDTTRRDTPLEPGSTSTSFMHEGEGPSERESDKHNDWYKEFSKATLDWIKMRNSPVLKKGDQAFIMNLLKNHMLDYSPNMRHHIEGLSEKIESLSQLGRQIDDIHDKIVCYINNQSISKETTNAYEVRRQTDLTNPKNIDKPTMPLENVAQFVNNVKEYESLRNSIVKYFPDSFLDFLNKLQNDKAQWSNEQREQARRNMETMIGLTINKASWQHL